jgi:DNA-directed RNA polymerase II subunit RPB9
MALRGIRFCKDCENILNAREQAEEGTSERSLIYSCRVCDYTEEATEAEDFLVYHRQVIHAPESSKQDFSDFPMDPTLPATTKAHCPKCGYNEAVYFVAEEGDTESGMQLTYVCCGKRGDLRCGFSWQK